ncbi:hypothetical protein K438DRAFT_1785888 [Mycena galopus ATCC 62051]|nr:hypothetical protein K438DRAFT_1785888 [Mycena galopus ATCC 62051]
MMVRGKLCVTRTLIIPPIRAGEGSSSATREVYCGGGANLEGAIVDPCSDGPGSSDDYQPDQEKQPSDSENEVMDASDEEAPKLTKTAGRTKKAAKGSVRDATQLMRRGMLENEIKC